MIAQAKARAVSENMFYNKRGLLEMQRSLEKWTDNAVNQSTVDTLLTTAWKDVNSIEDTQLFFILMFSAGDIANREHNMFSGKVNQGGHSKRNIFRYCLTWTLKNQPEHFYQSLPIISEYTNYENMFYNQLRTDTKKRVLSYNVLDVDKEKIAIYLGAKLKDSSVSDFEKGLIAKFLPKIPQTKRWRKTKEGVSYSQTKKPHTLTKDKWNVELIKAIKTECGWSDKDYCAFRSSHLKDTEAHLFSSKKITNFDTVEFKSWLDKQPAGARYRVQRRLLEIPKGSSTPVTRGTWKLSNGTDMGGIYLEWMKEKEQAMKKLVSLTEEDKKNMSTAELKTLTKAAKINTGATTIYDSFLEMYDGARLNLTSEGQVKMQQLVDKVKLDVPVLVLLDNSPSMDQHINTDTGKGIARMELATFLAALMLYKNPDEEMKSFMMTFNSVGKVIHDGAYLETSTGRNRFVQTKHDQKVEELVLRGKPFYETFRQLKSMITTAGGTSITAISSALKAWVDEDESSKNVKIEAIRNYPVWLIISDGDLNNNYSAKASMEDFQRQMLHWFGATPVVVLWDLLSGNQRKADCFEGLDNFVHFAGVNPATVNQIFLNIDDLDIIDVYISLKAIFESDRYEPVKQVIN